MPEEESEGIVSLSHGEYAARGPREAPEAIDKLEREGGRGGGFAPLPDAPPEGSPGALILYTHTLCVYFMLILYAYTFTLRPMLRPRARLVVGVLVYDTMI